MAAQDQIQNGDGFHPRLEKDIEKGSWIRSPLRDEGVSETHHKRSPADLEYALCEFVIETVEGARFPVCEYGESSYPRESFIWANNQPGAGDVEV